MARIVPRQWPYALFGLAKQDITVAEGAALGEFKVPLAGNNFEQRTAAANRDGIHDDFMLIDKTERCELRYQGPPPRMAVR